MKKSKYLIALLGVWFCLEFSAWASEKKLTILHTNDLHSHFLGFSPNLDYSPLTLGDDQTVGGWARLATAIKSEKANRENPILVLDAGDFLMGSLFHMVSRDEALELVLMKELGIDYTTLGNHEFDLKPDGLARILKAATTKGKMASIVSSNIIFNLNDKRDDSLEEVFKSGIVQSYVVQDKAGIKIGIFGLVGSDASEVAPFASPVKFGDSVETSRRIVSILREQEKVDVVICLSHSGLNKDKTKSEDELLAEQVAGIDVIISGHTHTVLPRPIEINNTVIVQAGSYARYLGVLDLVIEKDKVKLGSYKQIEINDSIIGDESIQKQITSYMRIIDTKVLKEYGLSFNQVLAESDFDLKTEQKETNLGNLLTDSLRWAVDKAEYDPRDPLSKVRVAVQSNGVIRDNLMRGKTGKITVSDLFRVVPLGIGMDNTMSYPLVTFFINGSEIKKALEVLTTVYPMKGSDYFLQFSGLKIKYNPNRMYFDRVTEILIEENSQFVPLDSSDSNPQLYKMTSNFYNSTFLKVIGSFTSGILTIVPKDKNGNPIKDLTTVLVDADKSKPGIQEIKDWTALMEYVQSFEDKNSNGIPEIPERYRSTENRQVIDSSLNPYKLIAGGNYLTWSAVGAIASAILLIAYAVVRTIRRIRT
ncbi:bifunctional metallophosphatase/5'-nucleotidase [bacterium]|nr:bifunctional metallophosphatase/5'-nucleotidase [bacterium]